MLNSALNKKLTFLSILIILSLLIPCFAFGQGKVSYVKKGEEVKFDGVLLSWEAYSDLSISKEKSERLLDIELDFKEKEYEALLEYEKTLSEKKLEATEKMFQQRLSLKGEEIDMLYRQIDNENTWWQRNKDTVGFFIGVVTAIGSIYIADLVEDKIEK